MNSWLFLIPLISACIGWLLHIFSGNYFLYSYLPAKKDKIATALGAQIQSILPFASIEEKISSPALIEKAMPMIEAHIDEFLSVKLPQEIPMLAMFVGNKTTDKIKEVFITQLKALFPRVMDNMIADFKGSFHIDTIIRNELNKTDLTNLLKKELSGTILKFGYMGILTGFIIGWINLLLFYLLS
ncbi:DUF445 domain-containing protein [Niabella aquatica]